MTLPPVILDYLFSTSPSQLQVSTATAAATGRINVSVSSGSTDKFCSQIMVAVPIGTEATDFSENTPTAAVNTADWSVSSAEIVSGIDLGLEIETSFASFTFTAKNASVYKIDYNLVLSLSATVNETVGSFGYIVRETSGTDATTLTNKQSTFNLEKVLPSFYLENFVATTVASPLIPATEFANGAEIRLAWESNGTWFQVYEKNNATPIYSGPAKTFTVSGGAATNTTYFLMASVTGDPGNDGGGFEPIYLFESLTVTITNPDLTPKTVAVSGMLSAGGTTSLKDTSVGGMLGVAGATSLKNTGVDGTLGVTGSASINGTLYVKGVTTLYQLAYLLGGLTATSSVVSMLGNASPVNPGSYIAHTDGFVLGFVGHPTDIQKLCVTSVIGASGGATANAVGGTMAAINSSGSFYYATNMNSFFLPVCNGNSWNISVSNASDNEVNAPTAFYWIPLGSVPSGSTFSKLSDDPGEFEAFSQLKPELISAEAPPDLPNGEFHHSGGASLSNGRAKVTFGDGISDLLFHTDYEPYEVFLTPTSQVGGGSSGRGGLWGWLRRKLGVPASAVALTITAKARDHFVVEQLGGGVEDLTFDWFIIARKPDGLNAASPEELSDALPKFSPPAPGSKGNAASAE